MATTFGRREEGSKAFREVPLTSQAAKAKGWTLLSSCEGKFPGIRYTEPSEPSLVAIYDRNDIIAGLQAVILEEDLNSTSVEHFGRGIPENELFSSEKVKLTVYIKDLLLKKPAFFSTVLFTDPKAICKDTVKRTLEGGLGDQVGVQYENGYFHEIPMSERRAVEIGNIVAWKLPDNYPRLGWPDWRRRKCAEGMGLHLVQPFDYISPCGETPVQGLYDQGNLIGFAWSVWWLGGPVDRLQGDRWEDPTAQQIQDNMKR